MTGRFRLPAPSRSRLFHMASAAALVAVLPGIAYAEGQLKFTVIDAKTKKPLPEAVIRIDPSASELDEVQFKTDAQGTVTTGDLSSGIRRFTVTAIVAGVTYRTFVGRVNVIDNQVIPVNLELDERGVSDVRVDQALVRIDVEDTSHYTFRDRNFNTLIPFGVGDRTSLNKVLRSVPGMVGDSLGRLHPRGGQDNGAFSVDGFLLPPTLTGLTASFLLPDAFDTIRARTGGLSPAQGGSTGAFFDLGLRPALGTGNSVLTPFIEARLDAGEYNSNNLQVSVGRQLPMSNGRAFGYFVALSQRATDNALESPQPQRQLSNNRQKETAILGKAELRFDPKSSLGVLFASATAQTGVANRVGLSDDYINRGQGFGFGGRQNGADFIPFPGFAPWSQEVLQNNVRQNDSSDLVVLNFKRDINAYTRATIAVGSGGARQYLRNNNPAAPSILPFDSSLEYNPNVGSTADHSQLQADVAFSGPGSPHKFQLGVVVRSTEGEDFFQYESQSQVAQNALGIISPFLGSALQPSGSRIPVLRVFRKTDQTSFYGQDTWALRQDIRVNYGLRVESLKETSALRADLPGENIPPNLYNTNRSVTKVLPRINVAYQVPRVGSFSIGKRRLINLKSTQPTVIRLSYNETLNAPGVGQGSFGIGQAGSDPLPPAPETAKQIDLSIERQLRNQKVRASLYNKDITNAVRYQQVVLGTQASGYSTINDPRAKVRGFELSYEFNPREFNALPGELKPVIGMIGFVTYSNSTATRTLGSGVSGTNYGDSSDQDQRQTVSAGLGYQFRDGRQMGFSLLYGSGLATSTVDPGGSRSSILELNYRLASRPNLIANAVGLEFSVENLLDSRGVLNFNGPYAGTRFQQGRRLVLSATGRF